MVLSINSIGFSFVDDAPLVEEVVSILESDDFLLFIGVRRLAHRLHAVPAEAVTCIPDHVVCEVYHGWSELCTRRLLASHCGPLSGLLGSQSLRNDVP